MLHREYQIQSVYQTPPSNPRILESGDFRQIKFFNLLLLKDLRGLKKKICEVIAGIF